MNFKTLSAIAKWTHRSNHARSQHAKTPAYSVHADDVITSWGANPMTGLRDYQPASNNVQHQCLHQPQKRVQSRQEQKSQSSRASNHSMHKQQTESNFPTAQPRTSATMKSFFATFLFFTLYIITRAFPAIRALKTQGTDCLIYMAAIVDLACVSLYLWFLGRVVGAISQLVLDVFGLASWIASPMTLGGLGVLFWLVREEKK